MLTLWSIFGFILSTMTCCILEFVYERIILKKQSVIKEYFKLCFKKMFDFVESCFELINICCKCIEFSCCKCWCCTILSNGGTDNDDGDNDNNNNNNNGIRSNNENNNDNNDNDCRNAMDQRPE